MTLRQAPFLVGVFLISFALLVFQIVQTRILSVIAWYYLAFFGISMAMLGMTVGAVHVYLNRERFERENLASVLATNSLACALSTTASLIFQMSLITAPTISATTVLAWILLTCAMAVPYVFGGIVISLALTKSPFPVGRVYGVDLLGAALGCVCVLVLLHAIDAPSTIVVASAIAAAAGVCFSASGKIGQQRLNVIWWKRPGLWFCILSVIAAANAAVPSLGIRPILVKENVESYTADLYEKWNSFSRIVATQPRNGAPFLWAPSPKAPRDTEISQVRLNIDGSAGTVMFRFNGVKESIDFLRYDLVNIAYTLSPVRKAAIIGVGGGRDMLSAHLLGAQEIVGVELNPIFIDLHEKHPLYSRFSNLTKIPNLRMYVDDARSWFASTDEKFDLIQMSMIDTWAATGAGAFSLSENGLYTLEGWRAFLKALTDEGMFTVSRWYSPDNTDETGRMISLGAAALIDMGITDVRSRLIVAKTGRVATLVISRRPFTAAQLKSLAEQVSNLGFEILIAPGHPSESELLTSIVSSASIEEINRVSDRAYLDLSVPTDNRPFFFNQLKLSRIFEMTQDRIRTRAHGVIAGNLVATAVLGLILVISLIAVICTIVLPLRGAARQSSQPLIIAGTTYFFLIGIGFMLAEISLLQYFSIYLGHPIYSLGVCLFSLILASGLGSLASERVGLGDNRSGVVIWGGLAGGYLVLLQIAAPELFAATTDRELSVRVALSVLSIVPLGFLLGFAFPTGMKLIGAIDARPASWFWGINGAAGVLGSAAAIMISMSFGINVTALLAGFCYFCLVPVALVLIRLKREAGLQLAECSSTTLSDH